MLPPYACKKKSPGQGDRGFKDGRRSGAIRLSLYREGAREPTSICRQLVVNARSRSLACGISKKRTSAWSPKTLTTSSGRQAAPAIEQRSQIWPGLTRNIISSTDVGRLDCLKPSPAVCRTQYAAPQETPRNEKLIRITGRSHPQHFTLTAASPLAPPHSTAQGERAKDRNQTVQHPARGSIAVADTAEVNEGRQPGRPTCHP
jgi:hypothetical protein